MRKCGNEYVRPFICTLTSLLTTKQVYLSAEVLSSEVNASLSEEPLSELERKVVVGIVGTSAIAVGTVDFFRLQENTLEESAVVVLLDFHHHFAVHSTLTCIALAGANAAYLSVAVCCSKVLYNRGRVDAGLRKVDLQFHLEGVVIRCEPLNTFD